MCYFKSNPSISLITYKNMALKATSYARVPPTLFSVILEEKYNEWQNVERLLHEQKPCTFFLSLTINTNKGRNCNTHNTLLLLCPTTSIYIFFLENLPHKVVLVSLYSRFFSSCIRPKMDGNLTTLPPSLTHV